MEVETRRGLSPRPLVICPRMGTNLTNENLIRAIREDSWTIYKRLAPRRFRVPKGIRARSCSAEGLILPLKPVTGHAKKFITRLTIISFSDGFDSAIITVRATSVWSAMRLEPSLRSSNWLRLRK